VWFLILSVFLLFACAEVDDQKQVAAAKKYIERNLLREANLGAEKTHYRLIQKMLRPGIYWGK